MASVWKKWFAPARPEAADATYIALVKQARHPFFYATLGVPDTLDGRFEMIVLHAFLLQHRLLREPGAVEFARAVSEAFFDDMDRSVRELGVADTGVSKRIKRMGNAYNGRLQAYTAGLADAQALQAALARNLYGTLGTGDVAMLERMRAYMERQIARLAATPAATILAGDYGWEAPDARA